MTTTRTAVFFDMDGVTVQTATLWKQIETEHVLPGATSGEVNPALIRGRSINDAYDRLIDAPEVTVTVDRQRFQQLYHRWADEVYGEKATLLSGYHDLLERLTRNGITTGLVSASPREWVQLVLSRFELEQAYDTVVTASDINDVAKPNPHIYERAASDVDVSPDESIAVEDSRHGIQAATDAGMYCIAFRGQGNADADLGSADEVVDTTDALQTSVVSLLNLSDATPEIEKS
jgi:HAD superfamily hydrolase (TIGR01509 family)